MPRDSKVYLEDILEATRRIRSYTAGLSQPGFLNDKKTADAVIVDTKLSALEAEVTAMLEE